MQSIQDELERVFMNLETQVVLDIISPIPEVHKKAMELLLGSVAEEFRHDANPIIPLKFLESSTYEGVIAGVSWLTKIIMEGGRVSDITIDRVYEQSKLEYNHAINTDRDNSGAQDLKRRISSIVTLLNQKGPKELKNSSRLYVDFFEARYIYEFQGNFEKSCFLFESLVERGYEQAVVYLGEVYEKQKKYPRAKILYEQWANRTGDTNYYKLLVRSLSLAGDTKEAYDIYAHYVGIAAKKNEDIVPFILLKGSIENDDDLEEIVSVGLTVLGGHSISPDHGKLFQSAQSYVDRELRLCEESRNALLENHAVTTIHPDGSEFDSSIWVDDPQIELTIDDINIRKLFLLSMNALMLFDNSKIRGFQVFHEMGDIIKSGNSIDEATFLDDRMRRDAPREEVENLGKVEDFLELLMSYYTNEGGIDLLNEFFHQYPFHWIETFFESLDRKYAPKAQGASQESHASHKKRKSIPNQNLSSRFGGESPILIPVEGVGPMTKMEKKDSKLEDFFDTILRFLHRIYIFPEHKGIQKAILELRDAMEEKLDDPEYERTGSEHIISEAFGASLSMLGEESFGEYSAIGEIIIGDYGQAMRMTLVSYALDPKQFNDGIPDFIQNDYYLAWYLLISHLLLARDPDEDMVKNLLYANIFYTDSIDGVNDLNSLLISTLVFASRYHFACDFMLRTKLVTSPAILALFLSSISYLDSASREYFMDELLLELGGPDFAGSLEDIIASLEGDIDEDGQFAQEDHIECDLTRAYFAFIEGRNDAILEILFPWNDALLANQSQRVRSEISFLRIRATIENEIAAGSSEHLDELCELFPLLDFEFSTECLLYIFRVTFSRKGKEVFARYHALGMQKYLPIGLWQHALGLISDDPLIRKKAISDLSFANIKLLPEEMRKPLIDACLTFRYKNSPMTDEGDIALQSAFLLSKLPLTAGESMRSIYQYSIWLKHYLEPTKGYTDQILLEYGEIFRKSFGYRYSDEESEDAADITPAQQFGQFVIHHIRDILKQVEFIKIEFDVGNNILLTDFQELRIGTLRNFIEILQRIPYPYTEVVIGVLRKKYKLDQEFPQRSKTQSVFLESQYIH